MQSSSTIPNRTARVSARQFLFSLGLLLLVSLLTFTVQAQILPTAIVSGQVRDAAGKPVEFATVLLVRSADSSLVKGAITDAQGKYVIETTKEGSYRVNATQVGYQKVYTPVFAIKLDQLTYELPVLTIAENARTLGEVKVIATKPFIEQLPDKTVVNVENSVVASGGTALEVLERSPGVTVDTQNDRISLKGRDGVLVMIDGKPTYLSMTEVVNLLRNTPSNSVQTIELITNPSAKYDAAGNSGIINIRLKRGTTTSDGTNASATLGAGQGRFPKTSAGLTLNHRAGALSLFGNYNYDYRQGYGSVDVRRHFGAGDSLMTVRNLGYRPNTNKGHTFKAGADYALGKNNTFGVMVNGLLSNDRAEIDNQNLVYNAKGQLQETVTMVNASKRALQRLAANANFKHVFTGSGRDTLGRELTVDADSRG
jgi:hypothetical protein